MIHAFLFDTDLPFLSPEGRPSSLTAATRMGGLTLLRRALLMAWKAGAESVTVVASDEEAAGRWRESVRGLPVPVEVILASERIAPELSGGPVLILSALILPDRGALERLIEAHRKAPGESIAASAEGAAGPILVSGEELERRLCTAGGLNDAVRQLLSQPSCRRLPPGTVRVHHLDGPESLAAAEESLYRGLTSASDGFLDRTVHRQISRRITRRIVDLPITPNQVTCVAFALGLLAAWLFWSGAYWQYLLGSVLLQLSVVLDCVDGEVARMKYQFSSFGSWLDVITENVVTILLFAAAARAAAVVFGIETSVRLGALAVAGVVLCLLVITALARLRERWRPDQPSSLSATNRLTGSGHRLPPPEPALLDRVINQLASRDYSVLIVACAVAGRLEWLLWLAGIGSHLFWMSFAALELHRLRRTAPQVG